MNTKYFKYLGPLLGLFLFTGALAVLYHQLRIYHLHDILAHLHQLPWQTLLLALLLTLFGYLIMTGYDVMALRYVGHPLAYGKIVMASFISYAFSNNIGFLMIAGASVRYRLYTLWGLTALEITQVIGFCVLTIWFGFLSLGGMVFLLEPPAIPAAVHFHSIHILGAVFLALVAFFILRSFMNRPIRLWRWRFPLPTPGTIVFQIIIASLDWAIAGAVLYTLLPATPKISYAGFIGFYLLAQLAGLISQVPGGLGVFETAFILLLSPYLPSNQILGSLLAFRGMYYILPLFMAMIFLGIHEAFQRKTALGKFAQIFSRWGSVLVPQILSITTFAGGAILLFSGATPAESARLKWLKDFMPLPVIEVSHFLGSIAGGGLLLLARGLQRRIDAAYVLTALLLAAGVVFSLLKGWDYEEAILLAIMLGALLPCHRYFYRSASLLRVSLSTGWIMGILAVLLCTIWLGLFSFKHVEYNNDLWWHFAFAGNASRFLRGMVGVISVMFFFALARMLRPAPPAVSEVNEEVLEKVGAIVRHSPKTYANLAFLGDKTFLFSEKANAFIMYGIEGKSWVSMGDPIGEEKEKTELVWLFRELSDRYNGWTVFYEVGPEMLYLYLDLGLTLLKLGEEARVSLAGFSLEGGGRKGLRYTVRKLEKEGFLFRIVPREDVTPLLPELKEISDSWLQEKNTGEKGFSLGFFHEAYLKYFPMGLVTRGERIVAFANLWSGAGKEELSIDLMRYLPGIHDGLMEYLFIQIMLWGREAGYKRFNLGMAPLSGFEDRVLAPLWNRVGAYLYSHGEHFYNFQGLRKYKEKFDPEWIPKYLACPGGLAIPRILANIATLVSGNVKGVLFR